MIPMTGEDFGRLRWSILALLLLVAIGAAIVMAARYADKQAVLDTRRLEAEQKNIRGKLSRAREEEQEIRAKIARYHEILARGYVTPELRLDWIERIARIRATRKLLDLDYELAPQKAVDPALLPTAAASSNYEYLSSSMKLRMQLLHENDLLGFLSDLRRDVRALLVVRNCSIERLSEQGRVERATRAQLRAECDIDWITLREKK